LTFKWTEDQLAALLAKRGAAVKAAAIKTRPPVVVDQLRATLPAPRKSKYITEKVNDAEGVFYGSKSEAVRHEELLLLERAGQIRNLRRQVGYELAPSVKLTFRDKRQPALRYTADFVYEDCETGETVVEDVKSQGTTDKELERDFVMRCHLMKDRHGLDVRIVRVKTGAAA
jgi:hypothetical protein